MEEVVGSKRKGCTGDDPEPKRGKHEDQAETQTTVEDVGGVASTAQAIEDGAAPKAEDVKEELNDVKPQELPENDDTRQQQGGEGEVKEKDTVEETNEQIKKTQSNILEKGIIYFFSPGKVEINEPEEVSKNPPYIVLKPLPPDAKIGEGLVGDSGKNRLIVLTTNVLPTRNEDKFMAFVEKSHISIQEIKDKFMKESSYEMKTTLVAEGIYAITKINVRESYLAYMLTIPSEIGEVQKNLGLRLRGSFLTNIHNPKYPTPWNINLPKKAEYPPKVQKRFVVLCWKSLEPEFLDYENTLFQLVGLSYDFKDKVEVLPVMELGDDDVSSDSDSNSDSDSDSNSETETETWGLNGSDYRVIHIKGVFDYLRISLQEYPKVSTW